MAIILDSYSESNYDTTRNLNATTTGRFQSFAADTDCTLSSAKLYMRKTGSPAGNATISVYAHSGTYGSTDLPTGPALDSVTLDVSTLTTSFALYEFTFTGGYKLKKGTYYILAIEYTGDASNYITLGVDTSSPSHAGAAGYYSGGWAADSGQDVCFYVYATLAKTGTLSDNFNDNSIDPEKWSTYTANGGVVAEQNNRLEVDLANTTNGSWAGIYSKNRYDATGSFVMVEIPTASGGSDTYHDLTLSIHALPDTDGPSDAFISIGVNGDAGNLEAYQKIGGVDSVLATVAYDSAKHKWWRIRESGGTTYWEYSANGVDWTTLHSAANVISMDNLYAVLDDYEFNATTSPGLHTFDNFNIAPSITAWIRA